MNALLERLAAEEERLQFPSFSNADALTLGLAAVEIVRERFGKGVAVQVTRNGQVLFQHVMDGATENNLLWAGRKRRVVDLFAHSSWYMGEDYRERGKDLNALLPAGDYQAQGGSFPILLRGTGMVGSITVSGLASSADHAVCTAALHRLLEQKEAESR